MVAQEEAETPPAEFEGVLQRLRAAPVRPEVLLTETSPPTRLAPHAAAFAAEVPSGGEHELASGRLVLLHDPQGVDSWQGRYRFVALVRAGLDQEMLSDPLLSGVGWSWLTDALARNGAPFTALAGTVTRTSSESFGSIEDRPSTFEVEIRASWTPEGMDLAPHLPAWCELLCVTAGLPPTTEGVVAIPPRRGRHHRR